MLGTLTTAIRLVNKTKHTKAISALKTEPINVTITLPHCEEIKCVTCDEICEYVEKEVKPEICQIISWKVLYSR